MNENSLVLLCLWELLSDENAAALNLNAAASKIKASLINFYNHDAASNLSKLALANLKPVNTLPLALSPNGFETKNPGQLLLALNSFINTRRLGSNLVIITPNEKMAQRLFRMLSAMNQDQNFSCSHAFKMPSVSNVLDGLDGEVLPDALLAKLYDLAPGAAWLELLGPLKENSNHLKPLDAKKIAAWLSYLQEIKLPSVHVNAPFILTLIEAYQEDFAGKTIWLHQFDQNLDLLHLNLAKLPLASAKELFVGIASSDDSQAPCHLTSAFKNLQINWLPPQVPNNSCRKPKLSASHLVPPSATQITINWLRSYALCPLRAYLLATTKLKLDDTNSWLDPVTRGIWLHYFLACWWQEYKDQAALLALSLDTTKLKVTELMKVSLKSCKLTLTNDEFQYFQELLTSALLKEREREPFKVILVEQPLTLNLAGASLKLRIDRVDQLASGEYMLIDYKTGQNLPTPWQWTSEELEPQLPSYALALKQQLNIDISQLAILQLSGLENLAFKTYPITTLEALAIKRKTLKPGEALMSIWEQRLISLIKAICTTTPAAAPKNLETCYHCPFLSSCDYHTKAF